MITETGRPQASCISCGESVDAPDSVLGRAVVAAFEDMHRGHDKTESPTDVACYECGGRGSYLVDDGARSDREDCERCEGTGEIRSDS